MNKYDKRHLPFGNVFSIADPEVVGFISSLRIEGMFTEDLQEMFLDTYRRWILSSKINTINGLESYPYACYSNGTTESFDKFYGKYNQRRFRFFKGEFAYHKLSCRNYHLDWCYIGEDDIRKEDAVIISLPFSDTGGKHGEMDKVLDCCDILDVPVLIDCTYFGVCGNIEFDLDRKCVTEVTFSLSKGLSAAHLRIGMRLSKLDDDDPLFVNNKIGYINRLSAYIGLKLVNHFGPDFIFNKYRNRQLAYCEILGVTPSDCVMFGIGDDRWREYNRDRDTNRLSFHKFLERDRTEEIKEILNGKRKDNQF